MTERKSKSKKELEAAAGKSPVLQLALDFVELDRALRLAEEAVAGGVDWLEAGTPLIKAEGLEAVRALRRRFPDKTIVADMKTMDAGRVEVEAAARAGASVVHVLAAASDATIEECVEAGRAYGARIVADLVGVADPVARARQLAALRVDAVAVHTPIDLQMKAADPFVQLREIAAAVSLPIAVAGGINAETVVEAVKSGASVVIVGGAITKAEDAAKATREIAKAMRTGVRGVATISKRGSEREIREILTRISAANLSDAMHHGGVLPGIQAIVPGAKAVGPAFTVRTLPGDWAKPVEAIDAAASGDVIVIEAGGVGPAIWGELATRSARQRGLAGVVIDGAIRDTREIREQNFAAFARHIMPNAGEPRGFGEIGVPIRVGGVTVEPGDWILGDDDGVCLIPRDRALEWANRGLEWLEQENRLRREIESGSTLAQVAQLAKWEKVG